MDTGSPLSGVTVELTGGEIGGQTDSLGYFSFSCAPFGSCVFQIISDSYNTTYVCDVSVGSMLHTEMSQSLERKTNDTDNPVTVVSSAYPYDTFGRGIIRSIDKSLQLGTISGLITDSETGKPLIEACVSIAGRNVQAYSSTSGKYKIMGLAPGSYRVQIASIDHDRVSVSNVEVRPSEVTDVSYALNKK